MPTSNGRVENAIDVCDASGIKLVLEKPRRVYKYGWGMICSDAKLGKYCWNLTIPDSGGSPDTFKFDIVNG